MSILKNCFTFGFLFFLCFVLFGNNSDNLSLALHAMSQKNSTNDVVWSQFPDKSPRYPYAYRIKQKNLDTINDINSPQESIVLDIQITALTKVKADAVVDPANQDRDIRGALSGVLWSNVQKRYQDLYKKNLLDDKGDVWRSDKKFMSVGEAYCNTSEFVRIKNAITGKDMQIIHAVGPDCRSTDQKPEDLYKTYYNSLQVANDNNFKSIAFPAISTGVFGCDKDQAGYYAMQAITDFVKNNPTSKINIELITLVVYEGDNLQTQQQYIDSYQKALRELIVLTNKK